MSIIEKSSGWNALHDIVMVTSALHGQKVPVYDNRCGQETWIGVLQGLTGGLRTLKIKWNTAIQRTIWMARNYENTVAAKIAGSYMIHQNGENQIEYI